MQIDRALITKIWAHALEYPKLSVYGTVEFPHTIHRLGKQERSLKWAFSAPVLQKGIKAFYQSFDAFPPPPSPLGYPEGFIFLGAYLGIKGVLEMEGYRVTKEGVEEITFALR